jgi:tRNA-splicing ligase RtcB (3'-phosphate/5'-hydroxy nucleic acid ligase)
MNTYVNEESIIYLPEDKIDKETFSLAKEMTKSPVFNHIRIMPDCHSSSYCCVGMTSLITDKVIPQIVGGDIGCGISCLNINKVIKERQYEKIDNIVKALIPMGERNHKIPITNDKIMNELYSKCNQKLQSLKDKFPDYPFNDFHYSEKYYKQLISRAKSNVSSNNYLKAMGTLGGGNHYIEFNKEENGSCYLTVHCGSRHMGQAICNNHQDKIKNKKNYDKKNFLHNYLENEELVEYLIDMLFAQEFASKNRSIIIERICNEIGGEFNQNKIIESIHNYIDFDKLILRKGAISAEKDKLCIISLNMRDGILICKGKGNPEWNYSSAHGCGRLMSRKDARLTFNMKQYKEDMKDVYSSCICKETLDEIPEAYKDVNFIKELIGQSVDIVKQLYPIINIKGY